MLAEDVDEWLGVVVTLELELAGFGDEGAEEVSKEALAMELVTLEIEGEFAFDDKGLGCLLDDTELDWLLLLTQV